MSFEPIGSLIEKVLNKFEEEKRQTEKETEERNQIAWLEFLRKNEAALAKAADDELEYYEYLYQQSQKSYDRRN